MRMLVSSWLYNRRPVEIPVKTVRKPTRLTAFVGTRANVKQGQVEVITHLSYIVEYAGIETRFRFSVPEALADKLQITSTAGGAAPSPIKQKTSAAASTAVEGWVTWTIVMQRDVLGIQPFQITYDLSPAADADSKAEKSAIDVIRVLDPYDKTDGPLGKRDITVSRTIGELTVVKDRALSVSAVAGGGGDVEPIDVRELQQLSQDGFVAFRYFKQPVKLDLTANKYDVQGVIETVVSKRTGRDRALIEASVATYRCSIHDQVERTAATGGSTSRRRFEPLGVLVDRKPVSLEKADLKSRDGWTSYFVNVARTKSSDEAFSRLVVAVPHRTRSNPKRSNRAGGDDQAAATCP